MPNDARLGMVAGLGLVIAVAVFLVRKDVPAGAASSETRTASSAARLRPMQQVSGTPAAPPPVHQPEAEEREAEAPGVTVSSPKKPPEGDQEP